MNICLLMLCRHLRMIQCGGTEKKDCIFFFSFYQSGCVNISILWNRERGWFFGKPAEWWRIQDKVKVSFREQPPWNSQPISISASLSHTHTHTHTHTHAHTHKTCHACPARRPWNEVSHLVAWGMISSLLASSLKINWQKQIPEYVVHSFQSVGYMWC